MTASVPRRLDNATTLSQLADERSSGDLLLAPESLSLGHPAWVAHSHDSFFMTLRKGVNLPTPTSDLRFERFSPTSFFDVWRSIPEVGPVVDTAVLEFVEPTMGQYLVVALLNDQPVGTIRITTGFGLGGMSLLAVTSTARRGGVAKQLIAHGLLLAATDGCNTVHFQVDGQNERAIRLYSELGASIAASYRYLRRI